MAGENILGYMRARGFVAWGKREFLLSRSTAEAMDVVFIRHGKISWLIVDGLLVVINDHRAFHP